MILQFNENTQYRILENGADALQVSTSSVPAFSEDCHCFSVLPEEQNGKEDLCFSVIVTEQNVFRLKEYFYLLNILFSVSSAQFSQKRQRIPTATKNNPAVWKKQIRRYYTSAYASYKAVGRIRL